MPTIKIHQYLAAKDDGTLLDDSISAWTKLFNWNTPPYSHSEIEFPYHDDLARWILVNQVGTAEIPEGHGICFSSTSRESGGKTIIGTRFEDAAVVLKHPERWDTYTKEVSIPEMLEMMRRAMSIEGRPYNYAGLFFDFVVPFEVLAKLIGTELRAWYCSQSCWFVMHGERKRVSPRRLTTWILKDGFKLEMKQGVIV